MQQKGGAKPKSGEPEVFEVEFETFDSRLFESNIDRKQVICTEEEGEKLLFRVETRGSLNFHVVRDAAVDIYRPPFFILPPFLLRFRTDL